MEHMQYFSISTPVYICNVETTSLSSSSNYYSIAKPSKSFLLDF